ncbi:unnamed protein product [Mytilus edulis]|uniref:Uncharacterized protein n=1 Tax=Mytilus edulis TaxID=6550 RepID=A0A8S3U3U1_MYTED|nr:unnamed protein product [Mytilus edulis]
MNVFKFVLKDLPFHLETLKDIPRLVQKDALMVTYDESQVMTMLNLVNIHLYFWYSVWGILYDLHNIALGLESKPIHIPVNRDVCNIIFKKIKCTEHIIFDDRFSVTQGGPLQSSEEKEFEGDNHLTMGDYWLADDTRPIHEKEAEAILKALQSFRGNLIRLSVDVLTDSMAVIGAWNSQGSKCPALNCIMKDIFQLVAGQNVDLHLSFVPSGTE